MRSLNRIELIGRLGADPDVRATQSGTPVATLSVATNEQWTDRTTGEMREETEWHRVVLWQRLAEIAQHYLQKGSRVFIAGQLKTRKWQDQSGQDRYTTEIRARDMMMLDTQGEQQAPQQQAPQQTAQQPAQQPAPAYQPQPQQAPQQRPPQQPSADQPPFFDDDIPF